MEFSDWWSLERSALSAVTLVGTQNLMHTNGHPRVGDSLFEPINGFLEICFCVCKISAPLLIWSERGHTLRLWKIYQALFWRKESPVSLLSTPDLGGLRLVFSNTRSFNTNIIIIFILISFSYVWLYIWKWSNVCVVGRVDFEKFSKGAKGHSGFSVCYTN